MLSCNRKNPKIDIEFRFRSEEDLKSHKQSILLRDIIIEYHLFLRKFLSDQPVSGYQHI